VRPSQLSDRTLFDFMALGRRGDAPLPDPEAWIAQPPAVAADDELTPAAPKPDALAALRAKAFDPIWNP
jgi:tRNA 2-thiocytidine biosynthesis protein TtcA